MSIPRDGPYKVVRHHDNGSISIEKAPSEVVKINIRRVHPYYSNTTDESDDNDA